MMSRMSDRREKRPRHEKQNQAKDKRRAINNSARSSIRGKKSSAPSSTSRDDARDSHSFTARRSTAVRRLLEGIGTPEAVPFAPDEFQIEALRRLQYEDVLVTAPTGSGKTWIAREEIRRLLREGKQAWYTSPLKALTNSKYVEFSREFGAENVGILTGDRRENSGASLIVGTTEVFRNQLFDALRRGDDLRADLVILDEAHYLGDEERGHVWEEAIILTPARVRLLLLSATVGNAVELARWIADVRGTRCGVVTREVRHTSGDTHFGERPDHAQFDIVQKRVVRPVPLRAAFIYPEGELTPLVDEHGEFNGEISRYLQRLKSQAGGEGRNAGAGWRAANNRRQQFVKTTLPEIPSSTLLQSLAAYNLLPAIVFLPTRRRCDDAATEAALTLRHAAKSKRANERMDERDEFLHTFAETHTEILKHRHWNTVVRAGVAAHHAGHLPMWKVAIEEMMSRGLLDAIFATSTVAAGVDFPARTVVLTVADTRTNDGWRPLSASAFSQMTGRAGRRGKDNVGFIVVAPSPHQNPQKLFQLLHTAPDALESQFRATYTTLLNLLDAYGSFQSVREIVERSFAFRDSQTRIAKLESDMTNRDTEIKRQLTRAGLQHANVTHLRGMERLISARTHLLEAAPHTRTEIFLRWLDEVVIPNRVVSLGRSGRKLVFVTERRGANVAGIREDGTRAAFSFDRIGRVYTTVYNSIDDARAAFNQTHDNINTPLVEPRLRATKQDTDAAIEIINTLIERVTTEATGDSNTANLRGIETLWTLVSEVEDFERDTRRIEVLRDEVWQPFAHRAQVLHTLGYLDLATEKVTERGRWLADLRVDRPLLVGEGLANNLFAALDATSIAGIVAALASDPERSYGELPLDDKLVQALSNFERIASHVASVEWTHAVDPAPEMNYSAAATAARWAGGAKWDALVRDTKAEEGDLFRMLSRTGESLINISRLADVQSVAAERARQAARLILREPVRDEDEH